MNKNILVVHPNHDWLKFDVESCLPRGVVNFFRDDEIHKIEYHSVDEKGDSNLLTFYFVHIPEYSGLSKLKNYNFDEYVVRNSLMYDGDYLQTLHAELESLKGRVPEEIVIQKDQWDESLRGKKMASPQGETIFKYQIPALEQFELSLPKGAEILRIDNIDGVAWLWAKIDTRKPDETRKFRAFKTGGDIPSGLDLKYIGYYAIFVQMELGLYVFEDLS